MRKVLSHFLIFVVIAFAMTPSAIASSPERLENLSKEIEQVQEYLRSIEAPRLDMGVSNDNGHETNRFTKDYVFFNITHRVPSARNLSVDFNDLEELDLLSSKLENTFDMVVLDDSTFKFTEWKKDHLLHFKKLLKSGGVFIFGPSLSSTSMEFSVDKVSESTARANLVSWLNAEDSLVHSVTVPYDIEMESDISDAVEKAFTMYKRFQATPEDKWDELMAELKINWQPSSYLLGKSDDKIREYIAQQKARDYLANTFYNDHVIPDNIMRIVNDVFDNNVVLERDKPLPFESNYNETQQYLVTATKR